MPKYRKHNDAVKYTPKPPIYTDYSDYSWKSFHELWDSLSKTGGYRLITLDTAPRLQYEYINKDAPIIEKIEIPKEWM